MEQFDLSYIESLKRLPEFTIANIGFGVVSFNDIELISVTPGGIDKTYKLNNDYNIFSTCLGTRKETGEIDGDAVLICSTCKNTDTYCPGHFGHINFFKKDQDGEIIEKFYIYNPHHLESIIRLLNIICPYCNDMYFEKGSLSKYSKLDRIKLLSERLGDSKTSKEILEHFRNCKGIELNKQRIVYSMKSMKDNFSVVDNDSETNVPSLLPDEVYNRFENIPIETLVELGFSEKSNGEFLVHPKDFVMKAILVMPPRLRPTIIGKVANTLHPYSALYSQIVSEAVSDKNNEIIKNNFNNYKSKKIQLLVERLILNKKNPTPTQSAKTASIVAQIQSKEEGARGKMLGKRSMFTARGVITGDTSLDFGQISIPRRIANELTMPVTVTQDNLKFLEFLLKQDLIKYHIPYSGKNRGKLSKINPVYLYSLKLEIGDIVERVLLEGDYVIYNRQPTLSKYSMLAARVVINETNAIGLPAPYTTPANADYDGDEMNLHLPQTEEAMGEVKKYLYVKQNLISSSTNRPTFGQVLDNVTGSYLLSKDDDISDSLFRECLEKVNRYFSDNGIFKDSDFEKFKNRLIRNGVDFSITNGKIKTSGKALFSLTLPVDFSYSDETFVIEEGVLKKGVLKKKYIGIGHNNIFQSLNSIYGPVVASNFVTDVSHLSNIYLLRKPFSVGLGDCPTDETKPVNLVCKIGKKDFKELLPTIIELTYSDRRNVLNWILKKLTGKETDTDQKEFFETFENGEFKELYDIIIEKKSIPTDIIKNFSKKYIEPNLMTIKDFKDKEKLDLQMKSDSLSAKFENKKTALDLKIYEKEMSSIVNLVVKFNKTMVENYIPETNSFNSMLDSGAKGNLVNLNNIIGMVGQQNFQSKRLEAKMKDRLTCQYLPNDPSLLSRGFCHSSFMDGLSRAETWNVATAARQGSLDTANSTPESGYIFRRMVKSMEDLRIDKNGSVTNSTGGIVQFIYGEDSFNPVHLEKTTIGNNISFSSAVNIDRIFADLSR